MKHTDRITERSLFGHPLGLAFLLVVEGCWFFGYVGVQVLLTLYMNGWLLDPRHAGSVIGLAAYRGAIADVMGPLTPLGLASTTFGLFTAAAYGAPLLGGLLADRVTGQRRAALAGLFLLVAGHLMLLWASLFLIALCVIVLGNGLAKSSLVAQIGRLYADDDPRRTRAYGLYYLALNAGSLVTPLVCGTLAEHGGWAWGYGSLAIALAIGFVSYVAAQPFLPKEEVSSPGAPLRDPTRGAGAGRIAIGLGILFLVEILFLGTYKQSFNIFPVWAQRHVDLHLFGFAIPVTWFSSADGLFTIIGAALSVRLWAWQAARGREPGDFTRLTIGCSLAAAAFLLLALGASRPAPVPLSYPLGYFALIDLAIPWTDMIILSLFARAAPARLKTTMVSLFYLAAVPGNLLAGWMGSLYEGASPAGFWLLHAGIMGAAVLLMLASGPRLRRAIGAQFSRVHEEAAPPDAS